MLTKYGNGELAWKSYVHYDRRTTPSIETSSRDILTTLSYTCRAFANGTTPFCYVIATDKYYTWSDSGQTPLSGWKTFSPLSSQPKFSLPANMWLHNAEIWEETQYRVIATYGLGSLIAFAWNQFYAVETRSVESKTQTVLVTYSIVRRGSSYTLAKQTESPPLVTVSDMRFPRSNISEVPYEATHVKWLGPWNGRVTLFAAANVTAHEYSMATLYTGVCGEGRYRDASDCFNCSAHFYCPGDDQQHRCPPGSTQPYFT